MLIEYISAEVRLKVHDAKQEYREKRSTNRLPDDIAFELPLESTDLSVVLHRNDHIGYQVPITVERSGKIINHNVNDKQVCNKRLNRCLAILRVFNCYSI